MSVAQATAALKQANLTVGTTTTQDSATVAGGDVISSSPSSGNTASAGDAVSLVVSSGKVDIPSVVGQSGSQAGATLTALKVNYSILTNSSCTGGNVSAQSVVGEQPQNVSMTITVCTG